MFGVIYKYLQQFVSRWNNQLNVANQKIDPPHKSSSKLKLLQVPRAYLLPSRDRSQSISVRTIP